MSKHLLCSTLASPYCFILEAVASRFCLKSSLLTASSACSLPVHFPFPCNNQTSQTARKDRRWQTAAQNPLFPSFGCFTLCHLFPKACEEQLLFCLKSTVTPPNFLFTGTAHNRCGPLMFGFTVCFVPSRRKLKVF